MTAKAAAAEVIDVESHEDDDGGTVAALATRAPDTQLIELAAPIERIEKAFTDYQEMCKRLLDDSDYQAISQWDPVERKKKTRKFPKKSAWRKLSTALGVTFEIISKEKERDAKGRIINAEFVVRATAPNGRFVDGWGNCNVYERCCEPGCTKDRIKNSRHKHCSDPPGTHEHPQTHFSHAEHDIPATAETRAKNRAASDLFGMGEVSAEEIVDRPEPEPEPAPVDERLELARKAIKEAREKGEVTVEELATHAELHGLLSEKDGKPWIKWGEADAETLEAVLAGALFEASASASGDDGDAADAPHHAGSENA